MEHKYLSGNKTQCSMNNQNPASDPGVKMKTKEAEQRAPREVFYLYECSDWRSNTQTD